MSRTVVTTSRAVDLIRQNFNMFENDILLICVDELVRMEPAELRGALLTAAMRCMDESHGSTVFIFSALVPKDVEIWRGNTGRRICDGAVLSLLNHDSVDVAVREELGDARVLLDQPRVYRILLQCSGHPRAVFVFCIPIIKKLHRLHPSGEVPVTAISRECAKASQLLSIPHELTLELFLLLISPIEKPEQTLITELQRKGVLASSGRVLPILLREWATANNRTDSALSIQVKFHLDNALSADDSVGPSSEKFAEDILVHWDAARRLALGSKRCLLKNLFHGAQIGSSLSSLEVQVCPPTENSLPLEMIRYVSNFDEAWQETYKLLCRGCIVVSKFRNESAIEYLSPLWDYQKNMIIMGGQVKFEPTGDTFSLLAANIFKKLPENNVIPLLFTTHHTQHRVIPPRSVCFGITNLTTYLNPLGPLRLLMEKPS